MRRVRRLLVPLCLATASVGAAAGVVGANAGADTPSAASAYAPGHVLVSFTPGTSASEQSALVRANGARAIGSIADLRTVVLSVPVGAEQHVVDALQKSDKVRYAERDGLATATTTPNDTYWSQQWGLSKINAPTAWDTTTGASSVLIADLDTGIDFTHSDLQGKTVPGYDFINNDTDPTDDKGHGTATAGIMAADSNNAKGIAGVCWTCMIMPVKVLDSSGSGSYSGLASGVTWAADHGARVINMSLGGTSNSSTLQSAVQYALNHGIVVVAAAGNSGNSTPVYPAAYPGVLSVAGTTTSDTLYSWSNYGSWVTVAAPGCDYSTWLGGGYNSAFCGTSAAAPVVSGLAGLLVAAQPSATGTDVTSAIENSAVNIGSSVVYGRVDAAAALTGAAATPTASPSPSPTTSPSPSPAPSPTASTVTFSGSLGGKTTLRSYPLTVGSGTLSASLSYSKATSMTLQLIDSSGATIAQSSGASPVQSTVTVPAGTYSLVVSSTSRSTYTMTVSYASQ